MKARLAVAVLVLGCSSAPAQQAAAPTPPASEPPEPKAAPSAEPAPAEAAPPVEEKKPEPEAAPAPAPSTEPPKAEEPPSKPSTPPRDILTATEVAFVVDYSSSDAKDAADEKCEAEAAGDMAKRSACMTKARDEFLADVIRFKKAGSKWEWVTYKRKGSALSEVHTTTFEFGEETANSVVLLPKGKDQGERPLFKGASKIVIKVPNDYSLELDDPKYGHLSYTAKVGLVGR